MATVLVLTTDEVTRATAVCRRPASLQRLLVSGGGTPDVVVLDVRAGDAVGSTSTVRSALPDPPLLVLGPPDDGELGVACLRVGATGTVTADEAHDGLLTALERLLAGRPVLGETATRAVLRSLHEPEPSARADDLPLTPTQERIVSMMATGATNRAIAARLGLAEKTVKNYATAIYAALGVSNRTQAVALWSRLRPMD